MRRVLLLVFWCLIVCGAGTSPPISGALACGNYSHVWIAGDAIGYLEDGDLKLLLSDEGLVEKMRNGAMFPDGGYAVGDGYGETSHWEPFHLTYLKWIREQFAPPWSDEAAGHIAFLLGMAAHGIGDQLYDGMYLERHKYYDEHGSEATLFGVDGATDTCFAATQGYMEPPVNWLPAQELAPLYEKHNGHKVTPETLEKGHELVVVAIMYANSSHDNPNVLGEYMELYPWACGNQDNPSAPGSPVTIGPAVSAYWEVLWGMLKDGGEGFDQPLAATYFTGATPYEQPRNAGTPDSWVSFVMPRGLDASTVSADSVVVTAEGGDVHPVKLHVYYGYNSHLVNIKPLEDWADDTEYTVTVSPPIKTWDGALLQQSGSFTFATFSEPVVEAVEVTEQSDVGVIETADIASSMVEAGDSGSIDVGGGGASGSGGRCSLEERTESGPEAFALVILLLWGLAALRQLRQKIRAAGLYEVEEV